MMFLPKPTKPEKLNVGDFETALYISCLEKYCENLEKRNEKLDKRCIEEKCYECETKRELYDNLDMTQKALLKVCKALASLSYTIDKDKSKDYKFWEEWSFK